MPKGGPAQGKSDRPRGPKREPSEYEEEVLQLDRVTRVVKGGRRMRFRATVVIGNKKGKVGLGIGKSNEVVAAIQKAIRQAKKDILIVPMVNGTIPHEIKVKFKSARILLMPAGPGTGIIAGGAIRRIMELSGVRNLLSKILGTSNAITNAKATIIALQKLKTRKAPGEKAGVVNPAPKPVVVMATKIAPTPAKAVAKPAQAPKASPKK